MPSRYSKNLLLAISIYAGLDLLLTAYSTTVSVPPGQVGTFRSLDSIPSHLALLVAGGVLVAVISSVPFRRIDLRLMVLIPACDILTDLDHIPSALNVIQPIRPSHSFFFTLAVFVLILLATREASLSFGALAGFFTHIGIDTGEFTFLSPFSFHVYQSNETLQMAFLTVALLSALMAAYLSKKARRSPSKR